MGLLFNGSISNFLKVRLEKTWIILIAALIMLVIQSTEKRLDFVRDGFVMFQALGFSLLLMGLWFNRRLIGVWGIWLGAFANMLVMLLNGGKMPVSIMAIQQTKIPQELITMDSKHMVFGSFDEIKLGFLSDVLVPPGILGFGMRIVSVGDILVALGLFALALQIMIKNKEKEHEKIN